MIKEKQQEIDFYIHLVENLYSSIQEWLGDENYNFQREIIELNEEKTGKYNVEKLLLYKPEKMIAELKPIGLDIIGANGRVDLVTHYETRRFLYFKNGGPVISASIEGHKTDKRVFNGIEEDGWYWVESITLKKAYKIDQELFLSLLDEVTSTRVI